ncbi:caspase recruitment domain-containing protein 19 [Morone saxatilis]|uniref:caspase recruitment domain-containing protein 19 n=1 Tax=Morone saxatilis TaxID=34816 RepID=UPI0015E1D6BD|nr:caspase recruitment domain-containing protein 19 [Morone saxatilis]
MGDGFRDQLIEDSAFLKADRRLDTELVDKLILQLNRIYPQILTDKEATKFRNLDVPTSVRVGELLTHLQAKGEEACREFYRALHLHVEEVYYSLPTRLRLRDYLGPLARIYHQKYVLNDRGPLFFLGCFSVAVGMALFYYYSESKGTGGSRALGMAALGLKRKAQEVLIWYTEESLMK